MNWGFWRLHRVGETRIWRAGFYKTGANPKCSTALSKPSWPSVQWKVIICFFCKHYGRNRSQWGHCTHQQPLNALTSLHLPSWELHLRPDRNRAPSLLCPADLTDHCALTWGLDSRLNLVPVTASLCSPAVWGLLLRMLPVPGWMEPSCSSSLVWSLWPWWTPQQLHIVLLFHKGCVSDRRTETPG